MSIIDISLSEFFARAVLVLDNVQSHPDITTTLAAVGYDADILHEEQSLLEMAHNLYDVQIREYREQHAATQEFVDTSK